MENQSSVSDHVEYKYIRYMNQIGQYSKVAGIIFRHPYKKTIDIETISQDRRINKSINKGDISNIILQIGISNGLGDTFDLKYISRKFKLFKKTGVVNDCSEIEHFWDVADMSECQSSFCENIVHIFYEIDSDVVTRMSYINKISSNNVGYYGINIDIDLSDVDKHLEMIDYTIKLRWL